jgi:hypothetical protein
MARGWESKSIESQQDDAQAGRALRRELSPEERLRHEHRTALEMSLTRAQAELQAASQPAYRAMLQLKLAALRARLAELE